MNPGCPTGLLWALSRSLVCLIPSVWRNSPSRPYGWLAADGFGIPALPLMIHNRDAERGGSVIGGRPGLLTSWRLMGFHHPPRLGCLLRRRACPVVLCSLVIEGIAGLSAKFGLPVILRPGG